MSADLESVRASYERDRPTFEQLAAAAAETLRYEAAAARVPLRVEWRAKELHSLLKKVLFAGIEYRKVIDRAGVRVILESIADLDAIERVIVARFKVHKRTDTAERLDDDRFGYGGIHYYLEFAEPPTPALTGIRFECQVHTRAQALWAALSHRIAYKEAEAEGSHVRSLHRLAALLEVVDLEVARIRQQAEQAPGRIAAKVVELLEAHYVIVGHARYSPETTAVLVPRLLPLMGREDFDGWRDDFEAFMRENEGRLRTIYERYKDDTRHLLMSQPESLLVLYARERDPYSFEARWPEELGEGLRDSFVGIWPNP